MEAIRVDFLQDCTEPCENCLFPTTVTVKGGEKKGVGLRATIRFGFHNCAVLCNHLVIYLKNRVFACYNVVILILR